VLGVIDAPEIERISGIGGRTHHGALAHHRGQVRAEGWDYFCADETQAMMLLEIPGEP
jgi:hypothetical protein